jgi:hypothetical protein
MDGTVLVDLIISDTMITLWKQGSEHFPSDYCSSQAVVLEDTAPDHESNSDVCLSSSKEGKL